VPTPKPAIVVVPVTVETWRSRAACSGADPETFFPGPRRAEGVLKYELAKKFCDVCPAIEFCLTATLDDERGMPGKERFGMYGGKRPGQRVRLDPTSSGTYGYSARAS
jgi:WhiB family redox-sensing transcriptional regulator